jgi:hypothetical protein
LFCCLVNYLTPPLETVHTKFSSPCRSDYDCS